MHIESRFVQECPVYRLQVNVGPDCLTEPEIIATGERLAIQLDTAQSHRFLVHHELPCAFAAAIRGGDRYPDRQGTGAVWLYIPVRCAIGRVVDDDLSGVGGVSRDREKTPLLGDDRTGVLEDLEAEGD